MGNFVDCWAKHGGVFSKGDRAAIEAKIREHTEAGVDPKEAARLAATSHLEDTHNQLQDVYKQSGVEPPQTTADYLKQREDQRAIDKQKQETLDLAKQFDEQAAAATNPKVKAELERVAEKYRTDAEKIGVPPEPPKVEAATVIEPAKTEEVPVRGTQADVAQAREKADIDPYERDLKQSWGDAADVSKQKVNRYPGYEERLAQEISKKPRPVTSDEHVSLLRNWQRAEVEHQMAVDAVNEAPSATAKNLSQDNLAIAKDKLEQAVGAIDKSGSAAGRGFNIRKMILKEFYTPERMESRVQAAKGGKPLTEGEVKQVNDYSGQMRKARVESAKAESQRAADIKYSEKANGSLGEKVNKAKSIKDIRNILNAEAEAARQRILAKRGSMEWGEKVEPCIL